MRFIFIIYVNFTGINAFNKKRLASVISLNILRFI